MIFLYSVPKGRGWIRTSDFGLMRPGFYQTELPCYLFLYLKYESPEVGASIDYQLDFITPGKRDWLAKSRRK